MQLTALWTNREEYISSVSITTKAMMAGTIIRDDDLVSTLTGLINGRQNSNPFFKELLTIYLLRLFGS